MSAPDDGTQSQTESASPQRNDHLLLWMVLMLGLLAASIWWMLNQPWAGGSSGAVDRVVVVAPAPTTTTPTPVIPNSNPTPAPTPTVATPTDKGTVASTASAGKPAAARKSTDASKRNASRSARSSVAHLTRNARPLADNAPPKYPVAALRAGVEGMVLVRAEIGTDGAPTAVGIVRRSGNRDLDRAALSAVRNWRFQPALRNGKAVASVIQVPVDFVLDERAM